MSNIDDLAELLFVKFQNKFPLPNEKGSGKTIKTPSKQVVDQRLDQFYEEARELRKERRLWAISWARVVMKLQQRLLLASYPPEGVKPMLLGMIISSHKAK